MLSTLVPARVGCLTILARRRSRNALPSAGAQGSQDAFGGRGAGLVSFGQRSEAIGIAPEHPRLNEGRVLGNEFVQHVLRLIVLVAHPYAGLFQLALKMCRFCKRTFAEQRINPDVSWP